MGNLKNFAKFFCKQGLGSCHKHSIALLCGSWKLDDDIHDTMSHEN
jgi:hypothetical protein